MNTVLGKLVNGGNPQEFSREIVKTLAETGKFVYQVTFDEIGGHTYQLTVTFPRKLKRQTLIIPGWIWRHPGGIRQAILDDLKI